MNCGRAGIKEMKTNKNHPVNRAGIPGIVAVVCCALLLSCGSNEETDRPLIRIGRSVFRQSDMEAFTRVTENYPKTASEFKLATRLPITAFMECAALYKKERFNPVNLIYRFSNDWKWKKRYLIAVNFITDVLQRHLGYPEKELKRYYTDHRDEFTTRIVEDSAGIPCTTSVAVPLDVDLKRQIAERLFLRDYEPDSTFLATTGISPGNENTLKGQWIKYVRSEGYQQIFLQKYYQEKFGRPYPVSYEALVGSGKVLSRNDMKTLFTWMSGKRREMVSTNQASYNRAVELLMRWYLFSEKAKATGYASGKDIKSTLSWLGRFECAQRYISTVIGPKVKANVSVDSSMAFYSWRDECGTPGNAIDSGAWHTHLDRLTRQLTQDYFNTELGELRREADITFLVPEWDSLRTGDPAVLLIRADSLREDGRNTAAETVYRAVVRNFAVTPQGKRAIGTLAELFTERRQYPEAIAMYRHVLLLENGPDDRGQSMFMAGFIYDEYLARPEMAEVNYKWVLKNAPDCPAAREAEFMMLHLNDPAGTAEELRAEALRQGRSVSRSGAD